MKANSFKTKDLAKETYWKVYIQSFVLFSSITPSIYVYYFKNYISIPKLF